MSTDAKLGGATASLADPLEGLQAADFKGNLWSTAKLPEAWAAPASSSAVPAAAPPATATATATATSAVSPAPKLASTNTPIVVKKEGVSVISSATSSSSSATASATATNVKVENSPFVTLYSSNGLLAWPSAGTASINGLSSLSSALPSLPFSMPQVKASNNASSTTATIAQQAAAMQMFNSLQQTANMFGGNMKRFNRTPVACVVCHKAKSTCDSNRPCARCSRLGKAHLCKDRPHKKKGRPPKKRSSSDSNSIVTNTLDISASSGQPKLSLGNTGTSIAMPTAKRKAVGNPGNIRKQEVVTATALPQAQRMAAAAAAAAAAGINGGLLKATAIPGQGQNKVLPNTIASMNLNTLMSTVAKRTGAGTNAAGATGASAGGIPNELGVPLGGGPLPNSGSTKDDGLGGFNPLLDSPFRSPFKATLNGDVKNQPESLSLGATLTPSAAATASRAQTTASSSNGQNFTNLHNLNKNGGNNGKDDGNKASNAKDAAVMAAAAAAAMKGAARSGLTMPLKGTGDDFSMVAESVDRYLWEEVIDDMTPFFIKHPEVLSTELAALYAGANSRGTNTPFRKTVMDLPAGCQVLSPLFCMYLSYMSYYLSPGQFTNLQHRLAKKGVIIPNLDTCPVRKFDVDIAKDVEKVKAIAPVFRFRWCRKKPSVGINRDLNFPMATLKVSFYRSTNPRTFLLFIRVNEEFENIFGYKQAEVVRMSSKPFYYQLIHPKDWKKQLSLEMSMLLNKRRRFNTFISCLCKNKEELCCLETFQFHFNNQDLMTHFTVTFSPLPSYLFEKNATESKNPPSSGTRGSANRNRSNSATNAGQQQQGGKTKSANNNNLKQTANTSSNSSASTLSGEPRDRAEKTGSPQLSFL